MTQTDFFNTSTNLEYFFCSIFFLASGLESSMVFFWIDFGKINVTSYRGIDNGKVLLTGWYSSNLIFL